jgi:dienelactone hydrolase
VPLAGRTVVIVDDGIATGSTARAACQVARAHGATRVVLAAPVASPGSLEMIGPEVDEIVCVDVPVGFRAVGEFYADFSPTSDAEVVDLLVRARAWTSSAAPVGADAEDDPPVRDEEVGVDVEGVTVAGHLTVPEQAKGVVVFAHGSGSSRHSARNRYVASILNDAGFATLLFDLLTPAEEQHRANVFDIPHLADRLRGVTAWVRRQPDLTGLPLGYFGASTGAGAALWAAAEPDSPVSAVVSRGGRPDLADERLSAVQAPTLLIVGGYDDVVLELNRSALARLRGEARLVVVPGATHLFEEPGTLDAAADLARAWFAEHLVPALTDTAPPGASRTT